MTEKQAGPVRDREFRNGRQVGDALYRIDDVLGDVAEVYRGAVLATGPRYYDGAQVAAWAAAAERPTELGRMLGRGLAVLRQVAGRPAAVGQIDDGGHIGLLYVHGDFGRQGHGTAMLQRLIAHARQEGARELSVDASYFSARLFAKHGFTADYEEHAAFGGQRFRRWRMRRPVG